MNKLLEMIRNEKVEWKKLGDVARCFAGGTPKTNVRSYYDGDIPWIRSGEINFNIIRSSERNITKEGLEKSSAKMIRPNSVVLAMTGATVGRSAVVEFATASNQSVAAIENNEEILNYKFLYYYISNNYENIKNMGQGALTSLNLGIIKNFEIPIPSMETQERIVKILDTMVDHFTQLQAELQARNRHYEHYRDKLLSEEYLNKLSENRNIKKARLCEIAQLNRGKRVVRNQLSGEGLYPVFQNSLKPLGFYDNKNFSGEKTCIITAGAAGDVFYQNKDFWAADDVFVITTDVAINKYLYYCILNKHYILKSKVRRASVPRLSREIIEGLEILIPPISVQEYIVSILDDFNKIVNDINEGLPKEIELRQKQYEYYRERLLDFKREED